MCLFPGWSFWCVYLFLTGKQLQISDEAFYPFLNLFYSYTDLYKMIIFSVRAPQRVLQLNNCVCSPSIADWFLICGVLQANSRDKTWIANCPKKKKWEAVNLSLSISQRSAPILIWCLLRNRAETSSFSLSLEWCSLISGGNPTRSCSTSRRWLPWSGCEYWLVCKSMTSWAA